jgi:tRNA(His) guanylyltransferase
MASKDEFGDRMKAYEGVETDRLIAPELPLVVRLDGRAFSTFTRGMNKPFDTRLSDIMRAVTAHLIEQTQALVGYTQSDEITLILERETLESELIFGGRVFKIMSVLAAMASAKFTLLAADAWPERVERIIPSFDCRVFNVPSRVEAVNALVWREQDAARNAVQMVAQANFKPGELHGKSAGELVAMLAEIGVSMEAFPVANRLGRYLAKRQVEIVLSAEALARIPERHRPQEPVVRCRVVDLELAPLAARKDRVELIFGRESSARRRTEPDTVLGCVKDEPCGSR